MTPRQIARELGWHRSTVQIILQRALEKVAIALGFPPPPRPHWMRHYIANRKYRKQYRCEPKRPRAPE